eukprot:7076832-Prymnesium_polylepis.2
MGLDVSSSSAGVHPKRSARMHSCTHARGAQSELVLTSARAASDLARGSNDVGERELALTFVRSIAST